MRTLRFHSPHPPEECASRLARLVAQRLFLIRSPKRVFSYLARMILLAPRARNEGLARIGFSFHVWARLVHIKVEAHLEGIQPSTEVILTFRLGWLNWLIALSLVVLPVLFFVYALAVSVRGEFPSEVIRILVAFIVVIPVYLLRAVWDYREVVPALSSLIHTALTSPQGQLPADPSVFGTSPDWLGTLDREG